MSDFHVALNRAAAVSAGGLASWLRRFRLVNANG